MPQDPVTDSHSKQDANTSTFAPSLRTALPHYLPLGIFPLILLALSYGDWWLIAPFVFMSVANPIDKALGRDGRNMDPRNTTERRLLWHNLPVWTWAFLWPPTLIFGLWQILIANAFPIWQDVLVAILLTMEAQAVFVVGHELVHRRTTWERRLGEFLLASASYPQYATEHVYIHHAQVGTPADVGSAPKGESFWRYFPREVVSNLTNSWKVVRQKLARQRKPVWHYSNPFWRYGIALVFWYGLVFWMGGIFALLLFIFLGFCCVFSMKISNYFQHYGLRRVLLPNGRWEKIMPRHSWSADWKFSNWMFFNMQRHADHHAMASRQYPLLQMRSAEESPELPGTYGDMMNLVLRPKRWFEKMDPLVDQWRKHFYPEIDDWSPYDSQISATRPESFDAIIEIFGIAPRLANRIEQNPELLDNLHDREFTDLDLPKGFGPDTTSESIARRGLTRLYWTHEMSVLEMKELIGELPAIDAKESSQILRDWTNDKAFQIGMHVLRENLSPSEANVALSNLAEASVSTVIEAVIADFMERFGSVPVDGLAVFFLGDLASREAYPDISLNAIFVHDGSQSLQMDRLSSRLRESLANLVQDSLLFSRTLVDSNSCPAITLDDLVERFRTRPDQILELMRARCIYEYGSSQIERQFQVRRRELLTVEKLDISLRESLAQIRAKPVEIEIAAFLEMPGGLEDTERAARLLQLSNGGVDSTDSAPSAISLFDQSGREKLQRAASMWRDLQGIRSLIGEDEFEAVALRPRVKSLIAHACGFEDFDDFKSAVVENASNSAAEIEQIAKAA